MRTITLPAYLLSDSQLEDIKKDCMEIRDSLTGETTTPELDALVVAIDQEISYRSNVSYSLRPIVSI